MAETDNRTNTRAANDPLTVYRVTNPSEEILRFTDYVIVPPDARARVQTKNIPL